MLCDRSGGRVFYKASTDDSEAECEECGDTIASTVAMGAVGLGALAALVIVLLVLRRKASAKMVARVKYFNESFTPRNK